MRETRPAASNARAHGPILPPHVMWLDSSLTLEVERNVGVALSELIAGVTPVVSAVFLGGVRYRQRKQVGVLARRILWR